MKNLTFLILIAFSFTTCNQSDIENNNSNKPKKVLVDGIQENNDKNPIKDITGYVNFVSVPYGKQGNMNLYKFSVTSLKTNFRNFNGVYGVSILLSYFELNKKGDAKKIIDQGFASKDYEMEGDRSFILIKNDERHFDRLVNETGESIYGEQTIVFDETTETAYIFIKLPNYKGAAKITCPY